MADLRVKAENITYGTVLKVRECSEHEEKKESCEATIILDMYMSSFTIFLIDKNGKSTQKIKNFVVFSSTK